jgi:hypothetical protein
MSKFRLQTAQIAGYPSSEGELVFADDQLVAVLVHLSEDYGDEAGVWYIEAAFGPALAEPLNPTFASVEEAVQWIDERIGPT